ncbi:MFS transporter [Streptomyces hydrogenans]|uniref:MFS transporter n=1 Tax=Streptomyces hydrogenans TaxID=1873719 RepID=UPI003680DE49
MNTTPETVPTAPGEPAGEPVGAAAVPLGKGPLLRLMPMLTVANAAMYMVYMGIGAVLLPLQVEQVDPANKVAAFGLVAGVAAIFATVFNPLAGVLSDRSGRRNPWILGGGLAALGALALLGRARSVLLVTLVLPSAGDAARDMGVLNVANAGPQIIAPFLASAIVGSLGYDGLYVIAALITLAGAVSVFFVRDVR